MGQWKAAAAALIGIVSVKKLGFFGTTFVDGNKKATIFKKTLGEISDIFKGFRSNGDSGLKAVLKTFKEINPLGGLFKNFKSGQLNELQSIRTQIEDYMQKNKESNFDTAWKAMGDSVKNVDDRMKSLLVTQDGSVRSADDLADAFKKTSSAGNKFTGIVKSLGAGLFNALASGAIMLGVQLLFNEIVNLATASQRAREEAKKLIDEYKTGQQTYETHKKTVDEMVEEYSKLSQGVDKLGKNTTLTTEEYSKYQSYNKQIAEMFPTLIQGYNDTGDAIIYMSDATTMLNKQLEEEQYNLDNNLVAGIDKVLNAYKVDESNIKAANILPGIIEAVTSNSSVEEINKSLDTLVAQVRGNESLENLLMDTGLAYYEGLTGVVGSLGSAFFDEDGVLLTPDKRKALLINIENELTTISDGIKESTDNMSKTILAYFRKTLHDNTDGIYTELNSNDELKGLASALLSNLTPDIISGFDNSVDVSLFVSNLLDQFQDAASDKELVKELSDAYSILFENGLDTSKLDPSQIVEKYQDTIATVIKALNIDSSLFTPIFEDMLNMDELEKDVDRYSEIINQLMLKIAGVTDTTSKQYLAHPEYRKTKELLPQFLKDNRINTVAEIVDFFDVTSEAIESGVKGWDDVIAYWKKTVDERLNSTELTPLSSLVAPDSSSKEKIDAFKQDIQKIGEALNNFGTSAFDATDIYETFGSTFPEIIDGSELTEDALRRLAIAEWNLVDAEFEGTEGTENYRKALRALLDQALSTGSGFKSVLKNMAGMPQANEIKRQAEATGSKELMSLYYKLLGDASKEYDKLNKYTRFFTDAQKDSWTTVTSGARNADEAIQKWETHLKDLSFDSFGDVINDEVFQSVRTAAEQINEMFENDILDEDEIQTLREQFYFTDDEIAAGAVQDYQTWLNGIVELYAQKGGEAGEAWFKEWFGKQDTKTFSEIINQIAEEAIANASGRGGGRYDKKVLTDFQNQAKTLSNVEKEIFASQYREGDSFEEVLEKVNAQLQRMSGKSLPDLLNDDTFSALTSEAQELSSILQNGVNFEEGNTLLEKWGLTSEDVKNGLADTLLANMRNTIQGVSASAGAVGVEWFQGFKKTLYDSSQPIDLDDVLNFEFSFDKNGKMITQTLNEYASEIISKAQTIGTTIANITSDATASGHITWAELFGDPEQLRELESIVPGISSQIQAIINGETSETQVIANLKTAMVNLNTQYLENTGSIRETANLTEEASAALQRQDELVADATNYNVAYKNGLLDIADSLDKIYFDGAYEGARSFGQAVTDLKGELDTLNGAYTQLIDGSLRENSVEFKNLVADLTAQFPQLVGHTGSIHELAGAVAELMNVKGDSFVTLLDQLRNREGIPDELRGKIDALINSFHKLGTQPFSMDNAINVIKNARQELDQLATFMHKVNETGLHLSVDATDDVYNLYPELLKKAEIYKDGTIKINQEVYDDFINARQAEVQGDIQARIKELENRREVLKAAIAIEQKKIDIADAALKSKNMMQMQEALSEIKAIELKQKADAEANLTMALGSENLAQKQMDDSATATEAVVTNDGLKTEADAEMNLNMSELDAATTEQEIGNSALETENAINNDMEKLDFTAEAATEENAIETENHEDLMAKDDTATEHFEENDINESDIHADTLETKSDNDQEFSEQEIQNSDETTETAIENMGAEDTAFAEVLTNEQNNEVDANKERIAGSDTTTTHVQGNMVEESKTHANVMTDISTQSAEGANNAMDNFKKLSTAAQGWLVRIVDRAKEVATAISKMHTGDTSIGSSGSNLMDEYARAQTIKASVNAQIGNLNNVLWNPLQDPGYIAATVGAGNTGTSGTTAKVNLAGILGDLTKKTFSGISNINKFIKEHPLEDLVKGTIEKFTGGLETSVKELANGAKEFWNKLTTSSGDELVKALMTGIAKAGNFIEKALGREGNVGEKGINAMTQQVLDRIKKGDLTPFVEKGAGFQKLKEELENIKYSSEEEKAILEAELAEVERIIDYLKANGGLEVQPWHDNKYSSDDGTGAGSNDGTGGGDRDGTGGTGGSDKDPKEEAEEEADQFEEQVDWIEVRIQRIERVINKLDAISGNTFENFRTRNKAVLLGIQQVEDEFNTQILAYQRYLQEAENIDLSEQYKQKVREGVIDIEKITDENLKNQIELYKEAYEKALNSKDALYTLAEKTSQYYKAIFDNIKAQSDGIISHFESTIQMVNNAVSRVETEGYLVSGKFYEEMIKNAEQEITELEGTRIQMINQFQKSVDSGAVEMYSQEWYNMRNAVDEVTLSIDALTTSIVEYNDKIRQVKWDIFDLQVSRIQDINKEAQFMIDLMSNEILYNDEGLLTNRGMATKAMHGLQYNVLMELADQTRDEMLKINDELANDPNNLKLYDRREQLLEQQREFILAANAEKDALKSLVSDGINKTLESLQNLIDTYTTALDKQHAFYTYQKDIEERTKNITNLQKQLASLSGDDSEENRKRLQELNNSLATAQEDLKEAEITHAIQETKDLLSELFTNISDTMNARLDNLDVLIAENIAQINMSSGQIADVLRVVAGDVGYTFQLGVQDIFAEADSKWTPALAMYTSEYMTQLSNDIALVTDEMTGIKTGIIDNITTNADTIAAYINSYAAAIMPSVSGGFSEIDGKIGNSVYGIKPTKEAIDLARSNITGAVISQGGSMSGAIGKAKDMLSGKITNFGENFGDFKKKFNTQNTTLNEYISGIKTFVDDMVKDTDAMAGDIIEGIHKELDLSNVNATEGSAKDIKQGIYDLVAKVDEIVDATREKPNSSMTESQVPGEPDPVVGSGKAKEEPIKSASGKSDVLPKDDASDLGNGNSITKERNSTQGDGIPQVGDVITFTGDYFFASNGVKPVGNYFHDDPGAVEIDMISEETPWWNPTHPYHIRKKGTKPGDPYSDLGWLSLRQISGYALGTKSVDQDRYAHIDERGLETIIRPDGTILTPLARQSMVINAQSTDNLWRMLQDPEKFMGSVLRNTEVETTNNNGANIQNDINVNISIAKVQDFDDFMNQLQHSQKFEQLFDAMTNSRIKGTSKFNKFNVKFA